MTECVLDASAVVLALVGKTEEADALRERLTAATSHAPHLVDAEVGNVLRRHEHAGLISPVEAQAALMSCGTLVLHRHPHAGPLADTAWTLRHHLSFYDALYAALAGRLGAPLLTCDGRLARAPDLPCRVEVV